MKIRRALLSILSDAAYDTVQSFHSDSAVCFSVFLHHLPDLTSQHPPHVLLRATEVLTLDPCLTGIGCKGRPAMKRTSGLEERTGPAVGFIDGFPCSHHASLQFPLLGASKMEEPEAVDLKVHDDSHIKKLTT